MRLRPILATLLCLLAGNAGAQLLPGGAALPQLPVGGLVGDTLHTVDDTAHAPLADLRRLRIDRLLRSERDRLDIDPHGDPVLRGEFLLMDADDATLAAVQAAGFTTASQGDDTLGLGLVVARDTRHRSAAAAMRALQQAAPKAQVAFEHLYLPAGAAPSVPTGHTSADDTTLRVGLIDGGVDAHDPAFARLQVQPHGCAAATTPDAHGTAVARRLAGGARGTLYAADLWCGDTVGRATLGLVDALAWMARQRVPVINISLVGPDNPVLARAIAALVARGHVLVAAVGNDGPAAPPLYPASYPGVIGVSGVDAKLRALPEAASGPQVDFVASGLDGDGRHALRGTSFAAPIVARLAASRVQAPAPGAGAQVQAALAAQARDLGAPGRDPRYGDGLVGLAP